jgi:hypothetical protein
MATGITRSYQDERKSNQLTLTRVLSTAIIEGGVTSLRRNPLPHAVRDLSARSKATGPGVAWRGRREDDHAQPVCDVDGEGRVFKRERAGEGMLKRFSPTQWLRTSFSARSRRKSAPVAWSSAASAAASGQPAARAKSTRKTARAERASASQSGSEARTAGVPNRRLSTLQRSVVGPHRGSGRVQSHDVPRRRL